MIAPNQSNGKRQLPPINGEDTLRGRARRLPGALRGSETILLVDDDRPILDMIRRILSDQGYDVLVANTADHALELLEAHAPDIKLMLTDLMMPGMSGEVLTARCRQIAPHVRVVIMSGASDDLPTEKRDLRGRVRFLCKPFLPSDLLGQVRSLLDEDSPHT
jgi:two-component system cell cycle sensor histidine kinase/response regulator CckA